MEFVEQVFDILKESLEEREGQNFWIWEFCCSSKAAVKRTEPGRTPAGEQEGAIGINKERLLAGLGAEVPVSLKRCACQRTYFRGEIGEARQYGMQASAEGLKQEEGLNQKI